MIIDIEDFDPFEDKWPSDIHRQKLRDYEFYVMKNWNKWWKLNKEETLKYKQAIKIWKKVLQD